uniref:hypothetical protein n=1 Tax=Gelidibacter sp. TaxID=2018083 RepID=UPI00404AFF6C
MKIQTKLVFLFIISVLACNVMFSQKKDTRQPLRLVKYKPNVDAPLTAKELAQIKEVYGDKTQSDVLNHPQRVKDFKHLLRNRVEIREIPSTENQKPCLLLSEVSLFDSNVPNLTRDKTFNPETFNPLKYNFNFFARGGYMYKVDNTNYFIIIKSQYQ